MADVSNTVMPFGKHKNKKFHEIPVAYFKWLLENAELRDNIKPLIIQHVKNEDPSYDIPDGPTPTGNQNQQNNRYQQNNNNNKVVDFPAIVTAAFTNFSQKWSDKPSAIKVLRDFKDEILKTYQEAIK